MRGVGGIVRGPGILGPLRARLSDNKARAPAIAVGEGGTTADAVAVEIKEDGLLKG
jgi:hypothetical protein